MSSVTYLLWRHELDDGLVTTIYATRHAAARARVVLFHEPERLDVWCRSTGVDEAIVGGFFVRDPYRPLGDVWAEGRQVAHERVPDPYAQRRACVVVTDSGVEICARADAPARPAGDLLQAGALLVADGAVAFDPDADHEGFSAGAEQFDSDITAERHPRAALGIDGSRLLAVVCDGRSRADAGLTLEELASVMVALGARDALNLDGGGSTTLVAGGRLRNRPRADFGVPEPGGRGVATALLFLPP